MLSLDQIALVDCEASSLSAQSFPIEIGWCLADTGIVGSTLIVPEAGWLDWDLSSQAVHGITREELYASGLAASKAAELLASATGGRILYADGSLDRFWITQLFAVAALEPPTVQAFDKLLDTIVRPDGDPGGDQLARDLARAERQGAIIDQAFARAQEIAPKKHRAAADAHHLYAVLREVLSHAAP